MLEGLTKRASHGGMIGLAVGCMGIPSGLTKTFEHPTSTPQNPLTERSLTLMS